jgi:ribosomal protein S12 methylthiotransferase
MKTRSHKTPKVNVITLGCSKNLVDSEVMMGQLKANDFLVAHENQKSESDIVIINTCGFIENAKQESIDTILHFAEEKTKGNLDKLIVTGCLSHRYKDELSAEIPEVDSWFGTTDLPALLKSVGADYRHELLGERITTTPAHYAYVKISEGCNRPCSFCAIPLMRGKHASKSIEQLVSEIKGLVKNGVREVMLIAQDLTYYGIDIYGERKLADLLRNISDINGLDWIRLHYAYPGQFPLDILPVIKERENICKYLDMPVQHISDRMLKIMRRGITRRKTEELLYQIKDTVPGIALRTTLLVGHPGETQDDYDELCQFVDSFKFQRLGVFTYSHEDNTHAYSLEDDVDAAVKEERAAGIMEIQMRISDELNQEKVGQKMKVLVDRYEDGYFIGRTEADSPEVDNEVKIQAESQFLRIGDFTEVTIESATPYDLFGKV